MIVYKTDRMSEFTLQLITSDYDTPLLSRIALIAASFALHAEAVCRALYACALRIQSLFDEAIVDDADSQSEQAWLAYKASMNTLLSAFHPDLMDVKPEPLPEVHVPEKAPEPLAPELPILEVDLDPDDVGSVYSDYSDYSHASVRSDGALTRRKLSSRQLPLQLSVFPVDAMQPAVRVVPQRTIELTEQEKAIQAQIEKRRKERLMAMQRAGQITPDQRLQASAQLTKAMAVSARSSVQIQEAPPQARFNPVQLTRLEALEYSSVGYASRGIINPPVFINFSCLSEEVQVNAILMPEFGPRAADHIATHIEKAIREIDFTANYTAIVQAIGNMFLDLERSFFETQDRVDPEADRTFADDGAALIFSIITKQHLIVVAKGAMRAVLNNGGSEVPLNEERNDTRFGCRFLQDKKNYHCSISITTLASIAPYSHLTLTSEHISSRISPKDLITGVKNSKREKMEEIANDCVYSIAKATQNNPTLTYACMIIHLHEDTPSGNFAHDDEQEEKALEAAIAALAPTPAVFEPPVLGRVSSKEPLPATSGGGSSSAAAAAAGGVGSLPSPHQRSTFLTTLQALPTRPLTSLPKPAAAVSDNGSSSAAAAASSVGALLSPHPTPASLSPTLGPKEPVNRPNAPSLTPSMTSSWAVTDGGSSVAGTDLSDIVIPSLDKSAE